MLKLCAKDWLAARWLLLADLAVLCLYSLQPYFSAGFILAGGAAVVLFGLGIVFFLEDRNRTEVLFLSFPIRRADVVGARYLFGALLVLVSGAALFGVVAPVAALVQSGVSGDDPLNLISIDAAAAFLCLSVFLVALYLPFYHRFGFGRGTIRFAAAALGLAAAALAAFLPALSAKNGGAEAVFGAVRTIRLSLGPALFLAAVAAFIIVTGFISFRASLRFYDRREF